MTTELFHQVGHNANWNIDSFSEGHGNGLILSPVHQPRAAIEKLDPDIRAASIFDPQFYIPSSQKPKLLSYSFFPENVPTGFSERTFATHARRVARACLGFQESQGFRDIVIPMRFQDQPFADYIEQQEKLFVLPFLDVLARHPPQRPVLLSLPLTSQMIQHEGFRTSILNWVTAYPEISGAYLNYRHERETKQIESPEFLSAVLSFVRELKEADLSVVVGHQNTEALLFTAVDANVATIGSFENTRIFTAEKFLTTEEERRGPRARIYLRGLLNWIQFEEARQIMRKAPKLWRVLYSPTRYADEVLGRDIEPTFNQPQLYKHYFSNMWDQFEDLNETKSRKERIALLTEWARRAASNHIQINREGIVALDRHGSAQHLTAWLAALEEL